MNLELLQQQVLANRNALQGILDALKQIKDHDSLTGGFAQNDVLLIQRISDGKTLKITMNELITGIAPVQNPFDKEMFVATSNQTVFNLISPSQYVSVFSGRLAQIEDEDYSYASGVITFNEGLISGTNVTVLKHYTPKQIFTATTDQTIFNVSGSNFYIYAYRNRTFMIDGVDYSYVSNQLILTNPAYNGEIITVITI